MTFTICISNLRTYIYLVSNGDSMANEIIESESEINSTDRSHSSEYQRLLFVNS